MRIWLYWETLPGREKPAHIDLSHESFMRHEGRENVCIVSPENLDFWLPGIDRELLDRLPDPARRADYIRLRLLHRHGGLWFDSDFICLRPLAPLREHIQPGYLSCLYDQAHGEAGNPILGALSGTPIVESLMNAQDEILKGRDQADPAWNALGGGVMEAHLSDRRYLALPAEQLVPYIWWDRERLLSRHAPIEHALRNYPIGVLYNHQLIGPYLSRYSREDLLKSDLLFSRLLRIALGLSTAQEEAKQTNTPICRIRHASNLAAAAPRRGIRIAAARHIPEPVMRLYRRRASLGKS